MLSLLRCRAAFPAIYFGRAVRLYSSVQNPSKAFIRASFGDVGPSIVHDELSKYGVRYVDMVPSRHYSFVHFETSDGAKSFVEAFEGGEHEAIGGAPVDRVTYASEEQLLNGKIPKPGLNICPIPTSVTDAQLRELLEQYGKLISLHAHGPPESRTRSVRCATVGYATLPDAVAAYTALTAMPEYADSVSYLGRTQELVVHPPNRRLYYSNYSGAIPDLKDLLRDPHAPPRKMMFKRMRPGATSGYIKFDSIEDATAVLEKFHGVDAGQGDGSTLNLAFAKPIDDIYGTMGLRARRR